MPRKTLPKPKPKSKKNIDNRNSPKVKSFLGEESSTSVEDGTFHSADLEENQTDYGLDFTSSNAGARIPRVQTVRGEDAVESSNLIKNIPVNRNKGASRRKQLTPHQRNQRFLQSVKQLQLRTDYLIPKASFARIIREILTNESTYANRLTVTALQALQESTEMYLTSLFQDAYCCTLHRGRVTLNVKDIELTKYLRGRLDPGNR